MSKEVAAGSGGATAEDSVAAPPCPYCGGASRFLVSSSDRNRGTTTDVFDYYRCGSCGLVYMSPIPDNLGPFYAGGYQEIPGSVDELRKIAARERYRMKPILRYKGGGSLLEIGPWMGIFSCNAKDAGFAVSAIEMDQRCVDFLNGTVGIRALQSGDPAQTLAAMDETFDVIALWHCLEHLRDPWQVVEEAAKRLAPGGLLLIAMPNIESYEFGVLKARWRNLDAPRHLYFLPLKMLNALCVRLGLETVETTTRDELSDAFSLETWDKLSKSLVPVRYVRGVLKLAMKSWANWWEDRNDSGPGYTAVYRRPQGD